MGGFFSFFLLSCSLPFPQRCGSLQICLSGGERQELIWGVLVRDQGSREGRCNSGSKKTKILSLMVSLGRGRLSLALLSGLQGCLLTSAQLLALKSIPPGDCKSLSFASFLAPRCQMPFPRGPGQTLGTLETLQEAVLLPRTVGGAGRFEVGG